MCIDPSHRTFYIYSDEKLTSQWTPSTRNKVSVCLSALAYQAHLQPCTTDCPVLGKYVLFTAQRVVVYIGTLWKHPVVVLFKHSTENVDELSSNRMIL